MPTKTKLRLLASILLTALAMGIYSGLPGTENLKLIYAITLVPAGIGIGAFMTIFFEYARTSKQKKD